MATDDQPKRLAIVKEWYLLAGSTLGIVLGLLTLFDRFFAPSVRVLGVRPVYIRGTEESGLLKGNATRGIGFIVEVESGSREASLTSLEMSGRKYLTPNQWLANQADHVDITSAEVSRKVRRPFYSVWMSAWPEDGKSRIRLPPRVKEYVRLTLKEPTLPAGYLVYAGLLGFEDTGQAPSMYRSRLDATEFFGVHIANEIPSLPHELSDGKLRLALLVGNRTVRIESGLIGSAKFVSEQDWREKPPMVLFNDHWP